LPCGRLGISAERPVLASLHGLPDGPVCDAVLRKVLDA